MQEPVVPPLGRALVLLMALASGVAVASNYYAQPLLHTIAQHFGLSYAEAGIIVTTAQLSYGAGLILLLPLGDLFERRRMIVSMSALAALGLVISAVSPSLPWLLLGTALTGAFTVVAQLLVPLAAALAAPAQRGRAVGTVMSGLLLGILLARTVAGGLSSLGDWRTVYGLAAVLMLGTALALWLALPRTQQSAGLSYPQLMRSVGRLFVEEPVLRRRALIGALIFALFAMLWTPVAFLLAAPPFELADGQIGLFGLAGVAGALAANLAGRLADRGRGVLATTLGLGVLLLSWLPLALAGQSLVALLIGIVLLDLAVQLVHVSNQNAIYKLRPEARNRLNAGYMFCYFLGGAGGSLTAAALYEHHRWPGVCVAGALVAVLALGVWLTGRRA